MFDDPRKSLRWMEDELLDEELEDILYGDEEDEEYEETYRQPRIRKGRQQDFHRAVYEDEDDDEDRYMILPKKKGIKGLLFLIFLALIAAGLYIFWWMGWLV